jgi:hypothetical protein
MQPDDDDSEGGTSGGGAGRGRGEDVTHEGVVSRSGGEVEKVVAAVDGEGVRRLISSLQVSLFFLLFPLFSPISFSIFFF